MNNSNLPHNQDNTSNQIFSKAKNKILDITGTQKPKGFSLSEMFSEIFRKRSEAEIEEYFTVGVESTTPTIENVDTNWPKPWVFFRTLVGALALYFGFVMAWREFQNVNLIPGLIIIGSFATPFAVLIFFFEVNVRKNVSLYQIIRLLLFGGILSLIFSLFLFEISDSLQLNWLGASVAGIVEEPGKLLALILVINNKKYPYILNGLLFGAAIGAGFAAFESAGYALAMSDVMLDIIVLRGLLAPFAHIVWTAMSAGVLWKVKGNKKFSFNMLLDQQFLKVFGTAILLHMIWNSPLSRLLPFYVLNIVLGIVAWVIIFGLMHEGLEQLREEKEEALEHMKLNTPSDDTTLETMPSPILQVLINRTTEKASYNAEQWESSDFKIASELRKGIRAARVAFKEINEKDLQNSDNLSVKSQLLLKEMLVSLQPVFTHYRSLPSSYGEWECSALGIIEDEIKTLISQNYIPSEQELNGLTI